MKVEQIYTGCLAQGAYYIESNGEVAIIDPLREVDDYIRAAQKNNATIKYIFETHFHADFVSGHVTLAEKTGAQIVYGPTAKPDFESVVATDGQIFQLGDIQIVALHTPGHTMESTTYLLRDENGEDHCIFSGDTLFLGDVGRPDLAQKAASMTQEELAGILYDSLRNKIMPLRDELIVYPGHGAGSACGKNMMQETVDTLGNQKQMNYALRADMTKEEFIKEVTDGLAPPPAYFPLNVAMNKKGYVSIDKVLTKGNNPLSPAEFEAAANETEALIIDVRNQTDFVAMIKDVNQPLLLVIDNNKIEEAITRLSRVGFDNTIGYLEGGIEAWKSSGREIDTLNSISAETFASEIKENDNSIFDVRKDGEFTAEHVDGAKHTSLEFINDHLAEFPKEDPFYVHCAGGYRSVIASSILKSRGFHNVIDVAGGYSAIKETDVKTTDYVCPTTLK